MSRRTILVSAPLGLGAVVLLWAALAARGDRGTTPAPAKRVVKTAPRAAVGEGIAFADAPARPAAPKAAAPAASGGEFSVIEDRIRRMEEKLLALETKKVELTTSNQDLERELVEKQSEMSARMMAEARVRQWEFQLGLTDLQKQSLMELCMMWAKQDAVRPPTRDTWLRREDDLRGRLSAEQAGKLHDQSSRQSQQLWNMLGPSLGSMVGASKDDVLRIQQTLGDFRPDGAMLLPEGHGADWAGMIKEGAGRLQSVLTPEQMAKLSRYYK